MAAGGGGGGADPMAPPMMGGLAGKIGIGPGSYMGGPKMPGPPGPAQPNFRDLLQQLLGQGLFSPNQLAQQPMPTGPATQMAQSMVQHSPGMGVPSAPPGMFVPPSQQPIMGGGPRTHLMRSLLA